MVFHNNNHNNHLYLLHKDIKSTMQKNIYQCVYTAHKITHLVKKHTHKMLHKKVGIDYCKILENVEAITPCKS